MLLAGSLSTFGSQGRRHHPARAAGCTGMVLGALSRSTRPRFETSPGVPVASSATAFRAPGDAGEPDQLANWVFG